MSDALEFVNTTVAPKGKVAFDTWMALVNQKHEAVTNKAQMLDILAIHSRMKDARRRIDVLQQQEYAVREKLQPGFVMPTLFASTSNNAFYVWLAERGICADHQNVDEYFQSFRAETQ